MVANLLTNAGANRMVSDLHTGQIQDFDMPVDNLFTTPFSKFIKKINSKNLICVSPDMGGVARTRL